MSDPNRAVCHCPHCRIRGLMGPLMIITVGVLFLIAQYTRFSFGELWPVLLIAGGSFALFQFFTSNYINYALTLVI